MSLAAFQGDFCFSYMFSNYVWRGYGNTWLEQAAMGRLGQLALASSTALAKCTFGHAKTLDNVTWQGAVEYGKCLHMLARELGDKKGLGAKGAHKLLVPILVLLMHAVSSLGDGSLRKVYCSNDRRRDFC